MDLRKRRGGWFWKHKKWSYIIWNPSIIHEIQDLKSLEKLFQNDSLKIWVLLLRVRVRIERRGLQNLLISMGSVYQISSNNSKNWEKNKWDILIVYKVYKYKYNLQGILLFLNEIPNIIWVLLLFLYASIPLRLHPPHQRIRTRILVCSWTTDSTRVW